MPKLNMVLFKQYKNQKIKSLEYIHQAQMGSSQLLQQIKLGHLISIIWILWELMLIYHRLISSLLQAFTIRKWIVLQDQWPSSCWHLALRIILSKYGTSLMLRDMRKKDYYHTDFPKNHYQSQCILQDYF